MDDPGRVELRALCLDPDDPRWDGPVAARKEGLEAAREMVGNAAQKAREARDKVQASEAAQAVAANTGSAVASQACAATCKDVVSSTGVGGECTIAL